MHPDEQIARWALGHHSLITRRVAYECGLTPDQVRHRVRSGRWQQVRRDVWAPAGVEVTPLMQLAAAVWVLPAVASHLSASWLLGLVESSPGLPNVTRPRSTSAAIDGLRVHRTDDLPRSDTVTIEGIRCTSAIRTCIDMGARIGVAELERLIERARHRRLVHPDPLIARFLQLASRGRDGIATTRAALQRLDPDLEPAESDLETLLLQILREHGLPAPVRQHPVVIDGRSFRIDMAYPELRLAIESDGFTHHGDRSAFESDRERQNLLMLAGWSVLRFTWRQICAQPTWVAQQVSRGIDRAAA